MVAPPRSMPVRTFTTPLNRNPAPVSRSAATSNGMRERRCKSFSFTATSAGVPTDIIKPPTKSSSTSRDARCWPDVPSGAKSPRINGMIIWPTFSLRLRDPNVASGQGKTSSGADVGWGRSPTGGGSSDTIFSTGFIGSGDGGSAGAGEEHPSQSPSEMRANSDRTRGKAKAC